LARISFPVPREGKYFDMEAASTILTKPQLHHGFFRPQFGVSHLFFIDGLHLLHFVLHSVNLQAVGRSDLALPNPLTHNFARFDWL
jgi:hypothetical protein